jgi:hypothetical protein
MIGILRKFVEDLFKYASTVPFYEAIVHGLPGAKTFRKITPLNSSLGDVKDRIHECPVLQHSGAAWAAAFCRQKSFDPRPL